MKNKSLIEKAKSLPSISRTRKAYSDEELELFVAWLKDEVTKTQVCRVLSIKNSGTKFYVWASTSLKKAYQRGLIK